MRFCVALLLLLAGCGRIAFDARDDAAPADAQELGLFTPVALPPGGDVNNVALAANGDVFVALPYHGMYRSRDRGVTWTPCGELRTRHVAIMGSDTIFASDDPGDVFVSDDGCAHWRSTELHIYTHELAVLGSTLYAGTDDGLRAWDGAQWRTISTPFEGQAITGLSLQPSLMLIGSQVGGIARSIDNGQSWSVSNTGLQNLDVGAIRIAPSNPMRAYAVEVTAGGTTGALFSSVDGGVTWTNIYANGGFNVAVDPNDPNHFLFANYNSLFESTDGTGTVDIRSSVMQGSVPHDAVFDGMGGQYIATSRGVFFRQGTGPFEARHTGIAGWTLDRVALTPSRDGVYWATPTGALVSNDGGKTYNLVWELGGFASDINGIVVPGQHEASVVVTGRHVSVSNNRGNTFAAVFDTGAANGFGAYDVASLSSGRLIVVTRTQALYADPPWTAWTAVLVGTGPQNCYQATVLTNDDVVIACDEGLFRSTNQGASFQPLPAMSGLEKPFAGPGGLVLAGSEDGLWSLEGTWQPHGLAGIHVRDLWIEDTTWIAATSPGVYVSHDSGVTWTRLAGLVGKTPMLLARDVDGYLLVAIAGDGLYRSPFP
ncbi:MAG TPA: hypothetical protein VMZ53_07320 [Kofleriaceae bacterium]|nr:hypothetical protein [Kofleriaceae bacterium]